MKPQLLPWLFLSNFEERKNIMYFLALSNNEDINCEFFLGGQYNLSSKSDNTWRESYGLISILKINVQRNSLISQWHIWSIKYV